MFLLPTAADFKEWQIWHYQQRLNAATNKPAIKFLSSTLTNLIKAK